MNKPEEMTSCEVCGNPDLEPLLDLGAHPLCDDLVPIGDGRVCREYPIEIVFCRKCITAHQRWQVPKKDLFPRTYHYRSRFTADVLDGMSALADSCENRLGTLAGALVLDIGCNDGSLLDYFRRKGAKTVGIEPTDAYMDALDKGHSVYRAYFALDTAHDIRAQHGTPDIITFTNVFAHIENLPQVVESLKALMTPTTLLVIENHYLGAVLKKHQFDTFYHEHPRTYSLTSFHEIARSLGAAIHDVEFPSRYGGNIRVVMRGAALASREIAPAASVLIGEASFGVELRAMREQIRRWQGAMKARLIDLVAKHGKLCAKAFPGRAAILVKLLDLDSDVVAAVYEKPGSMKIGHYLPGTRIPIKSDDEFFALTDKPAVLINFAWHIQVEIKSYLVSNGYEGEVIPILDPTDFTTSFG